jgi:GDP-4-dehydro-6-deoxy-D-mannose reductase
MRVLVTGAGGFVGRHLVHELDGAGYEILATDIIDVSVGPGRDGYSERVAFGRLDLKDAGELRSAIADYAPRALFHLAAQSSAARSFEEPRETLETNIFGTFNLLEAVRASMGDTPPRFLSVGSCEEYGRRGPEEMPLTERSPVEPVSPYAVSKAAQSMLVLQYHSAYGIECMVTRSFSHTGPGQTGRFVLPAFAKQCAAIKAGLSEPLIRVGNLDVTRDFLDVRDVVRAYRLLVEKGRAGTIYNVCRGEGLSLGDALRMLGGMTGREVDTEIDTNLLRPVDVPLLIGDSGRLREQTGWTPSISNERMLEDLFRYWEERITESD